MQHIAVQSLDRVARALQQGELPAVEVVRSALSRIAETESDIRAWVEVDAARALAEAEQLDRLPVAERGPLHGVPIGVKDIIDVAGLPTRCGSVLRDGTPATSDAAIVARLRRLGAVVLGKTVTTEFAYFNPGPTTNPHDTSRTPGGSSSGSAAAVAAGVVPLALGTQTAASVSRPAAYCGVAGFVSARGSFPEAGITGLSASLDTVGFLAPSVTDLDFLRHVLERRDTDHATSADGGRLTVLSWNPQGAFGVEPVMIAALEQAERALASLGHRVLPFDFADRGGRLVDAHSVIMAYDAVRLRSAEAARPDGTSPQLAALFEAGRATGEDEYRAARDTVAVEFARLRDEMSDGTVLLAPAAQGSAPEGLSATGSPIMSRPWQAMGLPVVVVPGFVDPSTGMPLGIQLASLPGREDALFGAARGLEQHVRSS